MPRWAGGTSRTLWLCFYPAHARSSMGNGEEGHYTLRSSLWLDHPCNRLFSPLRFPDARARVIGIPNRRDFMGPPVDDNHANEEAHCGHLDSSGVVMFEAHGAAPRSAIAIPTAADTVAQRTTVRTKRRAGVMAAAG